MKKYLLLILTMLSVSIGAWADSGEFGTGDTKSTWDLTDGVLTLTFNNAGDMPVNGWNPVYSLSGVTKVKVITASGVTLAGGDGTVLANGVNDYYKSVPVLDLSEASVTMQSQTDWQGTTTYYLPIADGNAQTFNNVIVTSSFSNDLDGFKICNKWNSTQLSVLNKYTVSGTTVKAVLNKTDGLTALSNISSTATTLKILNEVGAIDLSSVLVSGNTLDLTGITTGSNSSNTITVAPGVKVICLSDDVKNRVEGTDNINVVNPVISCIADEFSTKLTALTSAGVTPTSITITSGMVSTEMLSSMNVEGLTYLNLQEATVTPAINTIELPSTLKALVLPAAATMDETLKTKVTSSNLDYVYIPTNQTQDEDQTTADYIWVNKPGGLSNALDNEAKLRSSWYMVVESDVALNNDDVNFWGPDETARAMQYRYLDFSGANVTPAVLANYRVTDNESYRIILPNDWTGDDMAVFAANPNCGNIAAVYSYTGTDHKRLDILELHDKAYMPTALNNPRIVRSGTTSIRVVSGHYGSNPVYSKLGKNLLAAINGAASTITSVTIAVGSGIYTLQNEGQEDVEDVLVSTPTTFEFTNTNLTELIMNYVNNSNLTVDVHSCTNLQSLSMNEVTLAGIVANGITSLTTASLGHAIVGGDVNLSGTALTSLLEVDMAQITGTLDVSNSTATSFDFTQLTAKKIDASNTNSLTSLDINGVSLNNDAWEAGDSNKDGKVEVTRTGNNYSDLTITKAESFSNGRIIPQVSNITPQDNAYALSSIAPSHVEITAAGSALSTTAPDAVTAYNNAQDPEGTYTVGNVEILHVTGTLTADDINYIKNNLTGLKQLDLSGCTFADGVGVSNIISAAIPTTVAIVLPGKTNTEASTISDVKALQDANYECVAYYTEYNEKDVTDYVITAHNGTHRQVWNDVKGDWDYIAKAGDEAGHDDEYDYVYNSGTAEYDYVEPTSTASGSHKERDESKLNVYGYNGTVGNLYSTEPAIIDGGTIIKFLPRYQNTTVGSASHTFPQSQPSLLTALASVTNNGIRCVDMTWLDISNLGVDFSGIEAYHVIIPQNTQAATTTRNGIVYNNDFTKVEDETTYISTATTKYYKFHHNTQAVSTYKGTASPYATNAYFDGRSMHFDNGYGGLNTTAALVYVLKSEGLSYVYDTMSDEQQAADVVMIAGQLDNFSLESGLNNLTNPQIDLTRATLVTDGEYPFTWSDYKNGYVQYLALPDGMNDVIAAKSADDFAFKSYTDDEDNVHGLSALKAVGAYNPTANKYTVHSTANTVTWTDAPANTTFSAQENSVYVITKLCAPNSSRSAGSVLGLTEVEMSGYLTLADIQADGGTTEPGLNCNNNCSITTADFSNAVFMNNEDMTFTGAHWNGNALTSILLPTDERQKRIPARSLYNYAVLTEICIPYNYETIGTAAFYLANLGHITTTDANGALVDNGAHTFTFSKNLKEIGDAPSPSTTGTGDAAYPTPLSEPVFFSYGYHDLTDIYVLRSGYEDGDTFNPTKCYRNAFGAGPTYGWGGFDGGNLYCREKYMNGSQLFTVLHYPDMASLPKGKQTTNTELTGDYDVMEKAYTDPTRIYTKLDQTGALDANGDLIPWPTHSEFGRAYNQAMRGLVWNDWTIDSEKQTNGNINGGTITTPPGNPSDVTLVSSPTGFDLEYTGWHEFVLAKATYVAPDQKVANDVVYQEYADAQYYTFCVPFDMTPAEVLSLLGVPASTDKVKTIVGTFTFDDEGNCTNSDDANEENLYPRIYTLKGVEREMKASSNNITLKLTKNLANLDGEVYKYWEPTTEDASGSYESNAINYTVDEVAKSAAGNEVMIRGGYPYLIKAYLPKGTTVNNATLRGSLGKYVMSRYAFPMDASTAVRKRKNCYIELEGLTYKSAFARPYDQHLVRATFKGKNSDNVVPATTDDKPYYYRFMAQYWDQYMPTHTYYLYYGDQKWYYNDNHENWAWRPYTCIINACSSSEYLADDNTAAGSVIPVSNVNDSKGHSVFSENLKLLYSTTAINDTEFPDSNNARDYMFVFEDDDIMEVGENGSETTAIDRIDGVDIVPTNSNVYNMNGQLVGKSLNGLPKGMYIINGKKYVVK